MTFDSLHDTRVALQELHRQHGELGERMALVIQRATKAELEVDKLKQQLRDALFYLRDMRTMLKLHDKHPLTGAVECIEQIEHALQ